MGENAMIWVDRCSWLCLVHCGWLRVCTYVTQSWPRWLTVATSSPAILLIWCTLGVGVFGGRWAGRGQGREGELQAFCSGQFASSSCSLKGRLRAICHDAATYDLWGSVPWCAPCTLVRFAETMTFWFRQGNCWISVEYLCFGLQDISILLPAILRNVVWAFGGAPLQCLQFPWRFFVVLFFAQLWCFRFLAAISNVQRHSLYLPCSYVIWMVNCIL